MKIAPVSSCGLKIRVSVVRFRPRPPVFMRPSARSGFWVVSTIRAEFLKMASEPRVQRSRDDLKAALVEQIALLVAYCERFDQGDAKFAKPMATALRVLLHHHKNSKSVLQELGLRSGRFFTVAPPISPKNLLSECNLLVVRVTQGAGATYLPQLEFMPGFKNRKPFAEWWVNAVAKAQDEQTMSRMDIVQAVANMDGGAHVDPGFTKLYHRFRTGEFLGWHYGIEGEEGTLIGSPQFACIRAIAHELLLTLGAYAQWCFEKRYQAAPAT